MSDEWTTAPPHTVVGVRARRGPYRHLALQLESGLSALYGLNGAGKTWALRTLAEAGSGLIGPDAAADDYIQLFVEAPVGSFLYEYLVRAAHRSQDAALDEITDPPELRAGVRHPQTPVEEFFLDGRAPHLPPGFQPRWHGENLLAQHAEYVTELSVSTSFALVPTGRKRPEWEVWLCAPQPADAGPAVRRAVAEVVAERARLRAEIRAFWDAHPDVLTSEEEATADELEDAAHRSTYHPLYAWTWHHRSAVLNTQRESALDGDLDDLLGDGLPLPAARLFTLRDLRLVDVFDDVREVATNELTARELKHALDPRTRSDREERDGLTPATIEPWRQEVERQANEIFAYLLQDAPRLELSVADPVDWLTEEPLTWTVEGVTVDQLSRSESRWAQFAIAWVLRRTPDLVLVDEPEAALHRAAEEHAIAGLNHLAVGGTRLVVATHSPFALDASDVHLFEVHRGPRVAGTGHRGAAQVRRLPELARAELERLGLRPSDLLRRTRVFVLVEGEHDRAVLERVCGQHLKEARAHLIPIRGGRRLPVTVDSTVLFEFTDAQLVTVLDKVDADTVDVAWRAARERAERLSPASGIQYLREHLPSGVDEWDWLRSWLSTALSTGRHSRLTPLGPGAPDILDYLPVERLVPSATASWQELRSQHAARSGKKISFKTWLQSTYSADLSITSVARAAESLDPVPEELARLGLRIRRIASHAGADGT